MSFEHEEDNASHTEGVTFDLSREPVNYRIISARFNSRDIRISSSMYCSAMPQRMMPTMGIKKSFRAVQKLLNKMKPKNTITVIGAFNAKIGADNAGNEEIMEKHGDHGKTTIGSKQGELFANVCAMNQLVIGGSVFPTSVFIKQLGDPRPHNGEPNRSCLRQ